MNSLTCNCGKTYDSTKKFSVYDKNFCSINCLLKYKKIMEETEKANKPTPKKLAYGNSTSCSDSGSAF